MTRCIACLLVLGLLSWASLAVAQDSDKEAAALAAAAEWLSMADAGQYGQSWNEAAGFFRNAVTQDKWEQAMQAARAPLGGLLAREVKHKKYTTSLPGIPDGEYVVIQFEASFENKKSAIETVTMMLEKDGQWRVVGYYIQ